MKKVHVNTNHTVINANKVHVIFSEGLLPSPLGLGFVFTLILSTRILGIIVLYGWKVNVQEQNKIIGELHIPRENFPFPRS